MAGPDSRKSFSLGSANWRYFVLQGKTLSYYEVNAGGGSRDAPSNPSQGYLPGEGTVAHLDRRAVHHGNSSLLERAVIPYDTFYQALLWARLI